MFLQECLDQLYVNCLNNKNVKKGAPSKNIFPEQTWYAFICTREQSANYWHIYNADHFCIKWKIRFALVDILTISKTTLVSLFSEDLQSLVL